MSCSQVKNASLLRCALKLSLLQTLNDVISTATLKEWKPDTEKCPKVTKQDLKVHLVPSQESPLPA